jgi:hypothetical protein
MVEVGSPMEGRMAKAITEHGLRCLDHLKRARALGMSVAAYARTHRLKARMLYDAAKLLRIKGVIGAGLGSSREAKSGADAESSASRFVSVRVEEANARSCPWSPVLRVRHVHGHVLEFDAWPPAEVMAAALSGGGDVAA